MPILGDFNARALVSSGIVYNYQVFYPANYVASSKWPIILSCHGSGEEGTNNTAQLTVGYGLWVSNHKASIDAIVVLPQVPAQPDSFAQEIDAIYLLALIQTIGEANIDPTRIYLTGYSMGGYTCWDLIYQNPTMFAAAAIIASYIHPNVFIPGATLTAAQCNSLAAAELATKPIRTFHGSADASLPVAYDQAVNTAFGGPTATFLYTEYAGGVHNVWDQTYADGITLAWLEAQTSSYRFIPSVGSQLHVWR